MNYWLMKSEPSTFGVDDLMNLPNKVTSWEGVRNYQARNNLRAMKKGDLAFFYHSSCPSPGIVGIVKIIKESHPDRTAFETSSPYFDSKSSPDKPRWFMVEVCLVRKLNRVISLHELKNNRDLIGMPLLKLGNRLSVMPVSLKQWQTILALE